MNAYNILCHGSSQKSMLIGNSWMVLWKYATSWLVPERIIPGWPVKVCNFLIGPGKGHILVGPWQILLPWWTCKCTLLPGSSWKSSLPGWSLKGFFLVGPVKVCYFHIGPRRGYFLVGREKGHFLVCPEKGHFLVGPGNKCYFLVVERSFNVFFSL